MTTKTPLGKTAKRFCKHGHDTYAVGRRPSNRQCRKCGQEEFQRWREDNLEHDRAASLEWQKANPQKARESALTHAHRRRAWKAAAFVEHVDRGRVWERDQGRCGICGESADPSSWHLDHMTPLARGGEHSFANVQVAHPRCNMKKRSRLLR